MSTHSAQIGPILNNLKFLYPKPAIDPEWVTNIIQSIQEKTPGLTLQQQIKQVNLAFLESDLEQSTVHGTGFPLELITGEDMMHQQVLYQGQKQGCLVMIMAITEIGASAYNLKRTLNDKREVRSGRAQIRRLPVEEEGAEDGSGNGREEDEKEGTGPKYTRSMLKFTLSDGVHEVEAIEYRKIPNLVLGETRLGCKLVLQNVKVLRGLLLLTPENCSVKGYSVPQWCEGIREEIALERSLNDRLGIDPEPEQHNIALSPPNLPPRARTEGQPLHQGPIDIDFDDDDVNKEEEEEDYIPEGFELMPAHMPLNTVPRGQSSIIYESTSTPIPASVLPTRRAAPSPVKQPAPKRQNSSVGKRSATKIAEEKWDIDLELAIAEAEGMDEDDWAALDEMNDVDVVKKGGEFSGAGQSNPTSVQTETSSRFFRFVNSTVAQHSKSRPMESSTLATAGEREPIVLSDEETTWKTYRSSQLGAVKDQRPSQQGAPASTPDANIIEID
ncbi:Uncharacterized conserved protein [Phaffia rhodozyma]|uniref:RecQ-mediated genome instability protein 1 n=1 Tax=Phaffia rhodozyma TaxID=264483 RepID=A0A0F7STU2_PHARH|nr:Uncharacterized conserved protein [Phaffia rhodozyma]